MVTGRTQRVLFAVCIAFRVATVAFCGDVLPSDKQLQEASVRAVEYYQDIHRYPELGKQEVRTAEYIRSKLRSMGYASFIAIQSLPTATVAVLDSGQPGPVTCFRADMDAIRLDEKTNLPYASQVAGVMHACGHDAHTAILLGTADVLMQQKNQLRGKVIFLFQPAEESAGGADDVVADAAFNSLGITRMFALHVFSGTPVGTIQVSPGPTLAGSCSFTLKVSGKESHAALPHEGDDVVLSAAEIAVGLSKLPARKLDVSARPCVVSVAYFSAGDEKTVNRLPAEALLRGTIRAYEDMDGVGDRTSIRGLVDSYLKGTSAALGVRSAIEYKKGAPPLVNSDDLYSRSVNHLRDVWPEVKVEAAGRAMTSDDFSFYTARYPCLYLGLGIAKDGLGQIGVHQATFTLHPDAIYIGVKMFCLLAFSPALDAKTKPSP